MKSFIYCRVSSEKQLVRQLMAIVSKYERFNLSERIKRGLKLRKDRNNS